MNTAKVAILGAGQLGSRYLQGLSKCRFPLQVHVQDIFPGSLAQAEQRWQQVGGPSTHHEVFFSTKIIDCPPRLDLAIVATTADSRPEVVREIARHSTVRYWILEKVLAQSIHGLEDIQSHVEGKSFAWVNTPRRSIPWHQKIKEQLHLQAPLHLTVTGGPWGLACNAMHFLDVLAWWSGESLREVCTDQLDDDWFEAKRVGHWEIYGTLTATFSAGTTAKLTTCSKGDPTHLIELTDREGTWRIDEAKGTATNTDGSEIPGRLPYQSEMSASLVERILTAGCCDLPTLAESVDLHSVFIGSMQEHWKRAGHPTATSVPIT